MTVSNSSRAKEGRFERANALLFTEVDSIGVRSWGRFAGLLEITDTVAFNACVRDSLPAAIVQRDESDAKRLDIRATPTLLLDDLLLTGAPPLADLEKVISKTVKAKLASR